MFKTKCTNGRNNLAGTAIATRRKALKISQRELADRLQLSGMDVDKNAVQRMESGQRFIADTELPVIAEVLNLTAHQLIGID